MSFSINGQLRNRVFDSWKLSHDAGPQRAAAALPAPVRQAAGDAVDYLHMRAAALRNHLIQAGGRLYVLAGPAGSGLCVCEVAAGEGDTGLCVAKVAGLAAVPSADAATRPAEAPLDPSLAQLPGCAAPGEAGMESAGAGSSSSAPRRLLVSEGRGDLRLVELRENGAVLESPVLHPLRPRAPLAGVRPFVLLEAFPVEGAGGDLLHCICWTVKEGPQGGPKGRHCEVWALLLGATHTDGNAQQQQQGGGLALALVSAQRLQASGDVPHASAANPVTGALLVAAAPAPDGVDDDGGEGGGDAGAAVMATPRAGLGAAAGTIGTAGTEVPAAPAAGPTSAAAQHGGRAAADVDDDDDDDDVDPRTLAQAVARLAQFTSEERVGALPHQQWTDIYRESEPDGLGAPGSEPACDVALYEYVRAGTGSSAAGEWRRLSCVHGGAHSLITAQRLLQSPAVRGEGGQEGLLLGLADDVDCAVFRVAFAAAPKREGGVAPPTAADSAKPAAEARAEGEGAAAGSVQEELQRPAPGGTASQGPGAVSVVVAQEGCVPALAYVASGKTQRRHVLIGQPGAPIAAAIVEGQRYAYTYSSVSRDQRHGKQQVIDLQLADSDRVLGAALLQHPCSPAAGSSGRGSGAVQLVVLTNSQVLTFKLA